MNHTLHTAVFFFGWVAIVVALFFVQSFVRSAARNVAEFWRTYVSPILAVIDDKLKRYSGTLAIFGLIVTTFGTLLCAASTKWIGITDVAGFTYGVITLAIGMAATIKALD